jgi:predicted NUDIX family phosphoesterase
MSKILTLECSSLFALIPYFQGFRTLGRISPGILEKYSLWVEKENAEKNPRFKQLIGYSAVITPEKKIFTYRRSKQDKKYPEKRLQGKWSIGIGGHIEEKIDRGEFIMKSVEREIREEIGNYGIITNIQFLGGINDDSNSVGQVHFGLLMLVQVSSNNVRPKHKEVEIGEPKSLEELRSIFSSEDENVENWSLISLPQISAFLV